MPPPYPDLVAPLTPPQIEAALKDLNDSFTSCRWNVLPMASHEGKAIHYLKIPKADVAGRPTVLLVGGVHGRESAPPDALVRLAQKLLVSYDTGADIVYPKRTVVPLMGPPVTFPAFTIRHARIKRIIDKVDLYIVPCVNPDGRRYDQDPLPMGDPPKPLGGWRKNRRPHPDKTRIGVDLNRNFDIAWKFEDYYDMAVYRLDYADPDDPASTDRTSETYRGDSPPPGGTEPETHNVQWLINDKKPRFYVDVHQTGRVVDVPWALEENGTDPAMNWRNLALTGTRNGLKSNSANLPLGADYREFFSGPRAAFVAQEGVLHRRLDA